MSNVTQRTYKKIGRNLIKRVSIKEEILNNSRWNDSSNRIKIIVTSKRDSYW